jgi:hypothetical protein
MLVMARLALVPDSDITYSDTFSVTTTSGDFDDPVVLTNRVYTTGGTDYTVVADSTDITDYCTLGSNLQTVNCTGTGLADDTYTTVVTYRSGWLAYSGSDVFIRLKRSGTLVAQRTAPTATGYMLVGIYLTATQVTDASIAWQDANLTLSAEASPVLWASPDEQEIASASMTWHSDADHAALVTTLTNSLNTALATLEIEDEDIDAGDYLSTRGISGLGQVVATRAFSLITTVIPEAFVDTQYNIVPTPIAGATPAVVATVEAGVPSTTLDINVRAINASFPTPLTIVVSLILAGVMWWYTKSPTLSGMTWFAAMLGGWVLFGIPYALVMIPAAIVMAMAFMWVSRSVFE